MLKPNKIFCGLIFFHFTSGIPQEFGENLKTAAIVGGRTVAIESVPYIVQLQTWSFFLCGGSIISKDYIITAAHCTIDIDRRTITVKLGTNSRRLPGIVLRVSAVTEHPNYNSDISDFDFSIIKLATPIPDFPNTKMMPIALASKRTDAFQGKVGTVSGWGQLSETNGRLSVFLQSAAVPIVSNENCQLSYSGESITERMLCAGFPRGGVDACQGDSGGPLVFNNRLVGVSSWGEGCARANLPGVYARVSAVRDWINQITGL